MSYKNFERLKILSMFQESRLQLLAIIICLQSLSAVSFAESKEVKTRKGAVSKAQGFSFSAGLLSTSNSQRRGALLYDDYIAFPLIGINYSDWLSLGRGGVNIYKEFEWGKLTFTPSYFDDQVPFFEGRQEEFRKSRVISVEAQFQAEIKLPRRTKLTTMYAKEIKNHQGNFFEVSVMTPLVMSFPLLTVGAGFGFGDKKHNSYLFGSGAVSGFTHQELKLGLFLPFLPKKGVLIFNYSFTKNVQRENRNSTYTRSNDNLNNLRLLLVWKL